MLKLKLQYFGHLMCPVAGAGASADLGNPLWAVHFLDNKMDETNQHGGRDLAAGHSEGQGGAT